MGLDIYAGTLTRYYSCNWKNITQILSEENGHECVMMDSYGNEIKPVEDKEEIEQICDTICLWTDKLATSFDPPLPSPLWDEKSECDYFTDKPNWEALGALVMLQACHLQNCPLPEYVESGWNVFDEPVVKKAMSQKIFNSLLADVSFWLPIPIKSIFVTTLPTGNEATISTVALLKQELEELNQQIWKADETTILSWRNDNYYVPIQQKDKKLILGFICRTNKSPKEKYRTEELAQCSYSMLYQAVSFATKQQVPILLDY